jgi:catechol 2,3-dioxygenase-like lactoylglutathione lyase family enzyme
MSNPNPNPLAYVHLRMARPTNDIEAVKHFYHTALGLAVLSEFHGHFDFDEVMLGLGGHGYHLEFTTKKGHDASRAPGQDNCLVWYLPDRKTWENAVQKMEIAGYPPVKAFNPYWNRMGKTFEDPDGYRAVLQNAGWENETTVKI